MIANLGPWYAILCKTHKARIYVTCHTLPRLVPEVLSATYGGQWLLRRLLGPFDSWLECMECTLDWKRHDGDEDYAKGTLEDKWNVQSTVFDAVPFKTKKKRKRQGPVQGARTVAAIMDQHQAFLSVSRSTTFSAAAAAAVALGPLEAQASPQAGPAE